MFALLAAFSAAGWFELLEVFAVAVTAALAELPDAVSLALHPAQRSSSEIDTIDNTECVLFILILEICFELQSRSRRLLLLGPGTRLLILFLILANAVDRLNCGCANIRA